MPIAGAAIAKARRAQSRMTPRDRVTPVEIELMANPCVIDLRPSNSLPLCHSLFVRRRRPRARCISLSARPRRSMSVDFSCSRSVRCRVHKGRNFVCTRRPLDQRATARLASLLLSSRNFRRAAAALWGRHVPEFPRFICRCAAVPMPRRRIFGHVERHP